VVADAASSGTTVLLASHEVEAVAALADRVVTMAGGRVSGVERGGRIALTVAPPLPGGSHVA
jgi:ABC-type sugar transport system ATPase subunit